MFLFYGLFCSRYQAKLKDPSRVGRIQTRKSATNHILTATTVEWLSPQVSGEFTQYTSIECMQVIVVTSVLT